MKAHNLVAVVAIFASTCFGQTFNPSGSSGGSVLDTNAFGAGLLTTSSAYTDAATNGVVSFPKKTGASHWWTSSDIDASFLTNSNMPSWYPHDGFARMTNQTLAPKLTNISAGLNALNFNQNRLNAGDLSIVPPYTVAMLIQFNDTNTANQVFSDGVNSRFYMAINADGYAGIHSWAGALNSFNGTQTLSTNWMCIVATCTADANSALWTNAVLIGSSNIGSNALSSMTLGADTGNSRARNMNVLDVILWPYGLSGMQVTNFYNWITNRYVGKIRIP